MQASTGLPSGHILLILSAVTLQSKCQSVPPKTHASGQMDTDVGDTMATGTRGREVGKPTPCIPSTTTCKQKCTHRPDTAQQDGGQPHLVQSSTGIPNGRILPVSSDVLLVISDRVHPDHTLPISIQPHFESVPLSFDAVVHFSFGSPLSAFNGVFL
ncbi:hypothetical protein P879_11669 [Paragonimus westermani]|uniref:Uncharacterized protein n=1 Tax=Paragonimus westermani TaxID=34504 RepID=A0A8T0D5E9_9TREM|nr:hypothetical protein P879_11669 [Paragonimus westermani]